MTGRKIFDPIWHEIYAGGHNQRYPWDAVVSFVFTYAPKNLDRSRARVLEVGCGTASNLWFAAKEGFAATGVDASKVAIDVARKRFSDEGLSGEFKVSDFTSLPLESDIFDLAIDRAAITSSTRGGGLQAIAEVRRVLKLGGVFFFNPYADGHSSQATGTPGSDGVTIDISGGTLTGVGQICFYSERDIRSIFSSGWDLVSMRHVTIVDMVKGADALHSEWRVIAVKT